MDSKEEEETVTVTGTVGMSLWEVLHQVGHDHIMLRIFQEVNEYYGDEWAASHKFIGNKGLKLPTEGMWIEDGFLYMDFEMEVVPTELDETGLAGGIPTPYY